MEIPEREKQKIFEYLTKSIDQRVETIVGRQSQKKLLESGKAGSCVGRSGRVARENKREVSESAGIFKTIPEAQSL